ncbi:MAG: hypothetical protein ACSLFR_04860 [Solirubrobacteraceae bacterium]
MLLDSRPSVVTPVLARTGFWSPFAACVGLAFLSLLLPSTPTYDPWAWIIWGREITQFDLLTTSGPSWKPLPILFTTPFALFGDAAPYLWLVVARAGTLGGLVVAYRLGTRLGGPAAGVIGAVALALAPWTVRNAALGNSEGLLVLCVLWACDRHLDGHRGQAFALAIAAGMLRPEAWPFLLLYAAWLLWQDRGRWWWIGLGLLSLPAAWLLPEKWGSGSFWRAAERAQQPNANSPAFADSPTLAILGDAIEMLPLYVLVGLVAAVIVGFARAVPVGRGAPALGLAGLAAGWITLVAAMTEAGYAGNQRYLVAPAALLCILGGVGISWAAGALAVRAGRHGRTVVAAIGGATIALIVTGAVSGLPDTLRGIGYQVKIADQLEGAIEAGGGAERLKDCGHLYTNAYTVPLVAWTIGVHTNDVAFRPEFPAAILRVAHVRGQRSRPLPKRLPNGRVVARTGEWTIALACGRR